MNKIWLAVMAALALLVSVLVAAPAGAHENDDDDDDDEVATYTVTIRNLTSGQYLTPPSWAAHDDDFEVFDRGEEASAAVQAVAENGMVGVLADALEAALDDEGDGVSGIGAMDPIPPGGTATWTFDTDQDRFSLVAMVICTNDGFAGLDAKKLPNKDGRSKTYRVHAYDAGTEINTEARIDLVGAPFCGPGMGSGESNPALAENGEIRRHRGILGIADLGASFDWNGPVAELTVTRG